MEYQALYRKYRPKNLSEVYGQKVAVNILKNAVQNKKVGHAYLFTGSRGCGKTSVAKILARMVNCENLINGNPCGKCNGCINSFNNNCVDIIEIDAASNNGVDEIRELKSRVSLIPSYLKYKVYIIDEVHMLSIGAFNALLKTLEEPPEHVIFVLATTELNKVPATIVSRCQTIEFKKINKNEIVKRLKEISDIEKIDINDNALFEIASSSDGCLRDAIGLLDMATSYSSEKITEDDIYLINGCVSNNDIEYIAEKILEKNKIELLNKINEYYDSGKDLVKIFEKVVSCLKDKMISDDNVDICYIISELLETISKMKDSYLGKIYLEVSIFKICNTTNEKNSQNNLKTIEIKNNFVTNKNDNLTLSNANQQINDDNKTTSDNLDNNNLNIIDIDKLKKVRINNTFVDANKKSLIDYKNKWTELNNYTFDKEYGALICELIDALPVAASTKYLILSYNYNSFVEKGNMYVKRYEDALKNTIGLDLRIVFVSVDEWNYIKGEYVKNIKNNKKYEYIEDEVISYSQKENKSSFNEIQHSDIINKANELFDNSKIEIKESV